MNKRVRLVGGCFVMLLVLGGLSSWRMVEATSKREAADGLSVGQRPPAFSVLDLRGQRQTLKQYRGQVVVLHFWATWCPYCRGEIPKLLEAFQHGPQQRVTVVTVSIDNDLASLQAFVEQAALPYSVIHDASTNASLAKAYDVQGIPVTYLIDRSGRVAYQFSGASDFISAIQYLLAQDPTPSAS
ncbi:MAG: TlpA disulfide reductase family protein [Candidatus Omnitrophota bacterium]|nr:TlpA disulfide reductase family protein [Candidatus Omnitrophota bacterium]